MTPKHVARCLYEYGKAHPEAGLRVFEVPQLPGSLPRSRPVRGGAEAGLKTKRYHATLLLIQPEIPLALTFLYLDQGRWNMGQGAEPLEPGAFLKVGEPFEQAAHDTGNERVGSGRRWA